MCDDRSPHYVPHSEAGILLANSRGDGYTIALQWNQAFPDSLNYVMAYNIYFSTVREDVFAETVKVVSIDPTLFNIDVTDFTPGDMYYFGVRATEFPPTGIDLTMLPDAGDSKVYPESVLLSDLTENSTIIPIVDINDFPSFGIVQIGGELIQYSNKDIPSNSLINLMRGYDSTDIREHTVDGYDGYNFLNPLVLFWRGYEEQNETVFQSMSTFNYPHFPRTNADGYMMVTEDILTTDLGGTDATLGATSVTDGGTADQSLTDLPPYDYAGWHRTDPVALLRGDCVGTYYGGEQYCADGYLGVGRQLRGLSISDANTQRQEVLLSVTGEPVVLVRRMWTGLRCACFQATFEHADDRCIFCHGTGFISGYDQFVNPRRSDGRILVRFGPTEDDLVQNDAGLESTFIPDCFTIVVPAVKDRDFLIRFNEDGSEEFRYEILNVTRNKIFQQDLGGQKFKAQRVRKTDPIYTWRAIRDTSTMPMLLTTGLGMVPGPGGIPPHTHGLVIDENITSISQINQTTSISFGHNHTVRNGKVIEEGLGHSHPIII